MKFIKNILGGHAKNDLRAPIQEYILSYVEHKQLIKELSSIEAKVTNSKDEVITCTGSPEFRRISQIRADICEQLRSKVNPEEILDTLP